MFLIRRPTRKPDLLSTPVTVRASAASGPVPDVRRPSDLSYPSN